MQTTKSDEVAGEIQNKSDKVAGEIQKSDTGMSRPLTIQIAQIATYISVCNQFINGYRRLQLTYNVLVTNLQIAIYLCKSHVAISSDNVLSKWRASGTKYLKYLAFCM